ncbi:MAG: tetratricopeptide repeat protein [Actinomycetota bacterium]|nr:tetratricopeptide repeat protein [Actinomycetota bacterium]
MDSETPRHLWLCGGRRSDRAATLENLAPAAELMPVVDAHRNLRGPYTAAGTVVRRLAPEVLERRPELVRKHDIELLSVAPELSDVLPNSRETLTSMALPKERTRFYARLRTMRTSHGLVEFLRDGMPSEGSWTLVVENAEHAEATDQEFLAVALRRLDPSRLRLVICSGSSEFADEALSKILAERAEVIELAGAARTGLTAPADAAWQYVASDCTSDRPELIAGYYAATAEERSLLHDRRAAELEAVGEFSLKLGAIGYHLEHGSDPAQAGALALYAAQDHCLCLGFYEAVVDYGYRALATFDARKQLSMWWALTIELTLALSILGRTHEAMRHYDQARLLSDNPDVHMAAAYSTAMLYTRHNEPEERDEKLAKSWLNAAIATASLIEDRSERAFQSAFYKNGLALVEVNLGELPEALRLVDECIESLDRLLEPAEHKLHRSVLKNNRARVYTGLGRLEDALADYAVVIAEDPNHCEHYLERGNILRRLGRHDEAFDSYAKAITLTPPFPEIHYNRGDLRLTVGDVPGALADFDYVLELDPDFVDAYVNRAGIHLENGDFDAAYADAVEGLRRDPDNSYLLVELGQVYAERGEQQAAMAAFDHAIQVDPDLVTALSGRASLAYELGQLPAAIEDLSHAVQLSPADSALRYNRAFLYLEEGRWDEALADLNIAAELSPEDEEIDEARQTCLRNLASV